MPTIILILNKQNQREANSPVPQQTHKIAHDSRQMVLSNNSQNRNHKRYKERPHKPRYRMEEMPEQL